MKIQPYLQPKFSHSIATAFASFVLASGAAFAISVPVAQDSSSAATGKVAPAGGKAVTLPVNAKQTTLIRFDLSDTLVLPQAYQPGNIKSAVLRLYVISAKPTAAVDVHVVTTNWQETFIGPAVALPTISAAPVAQIPAADLLAKTFVHVDVTGAVIAAVGTGNDFGFALKTADPKAKVVFASKEGAATGYAAELEIEANTSLDANGDLTGTNANLTGDLNANGASFSNLVDGTEGAFTGKFTISSVFVVEARPNNNPTVPGSNIFIGTNAGSANTTGFRNTFVGTGAGSLTLDGGHNTFMGFDAGQQNTAGAFNSFYGFDAGLNNTTGIQNTFIGANAGKANTSGGNNVFLGINSGAFTNGSENVFLGASAGGGSNSTGIRNVFVGLGAGQFNTSSENCFLGYNAGRDNAGGIHNVFIGFRAGEKNTVGDNTIVGWQAGMTTVTGGGNSFFGVNAGKLNTGSLNSFIGAGSGEGNTTGGFNAFFGRNAGTSNTTEDKNTFIGDSANGVAGITNATALGQGASVTTSDSVVLGNNCSVGIRTSAPNSTLQVNGSLSLPIRTVNNSLLTGLNATDYVLINTGTLATAIVLPQPGVAGRIYVVKNRSTATASLSFQAAGPTIDGAASLNIPTNTVVQVICDGTNWFKLN